jgi:hypothetical protein
MTEQKFETPSDRAALVKMLSGLSVQVGDRLELKMDSALADAALRLLDAAGLAVVPKEPTKWQVRAGADACSMLTRVGAEAVYKAAVYRNPFTS